MFQPSSFSAGKPATRPAEGAEFAPQHRWIPAFWAVSQLSAALVEVLF